MESAPFEVPLAEHKNAYFTKKNLKKCVIDGVDMGANSGWKHLPSIVTKHFQRLSKEVSSELKGKIEQYTALRRTSAGVGARLTRKVLAEVGMAPEKCILTITDWSEAGAARDQQVDGSPSQTPTEEDLLPALNIILYGPPGTGKTHTLRNEYFNLFTDIEQIEPPEVRALRVVQDLAWWEVVAMALLDRSGKPAGVSDILGHPLVQARMKVGTGRFPRNTVQGALQEHTKQECKRVGVEKRTEPLVFERDDDGWFIDAALVKKETPELLALLAEIARVPQGNTEVKRYRFTTFHQSFSYEDFIEGIKPQLQDKEDAQLAYEIRPGIFKEIAAEAHANPSKKYALFIDEINRGNIASIFGELITLIEKDKRLDASNAIQVDLPYSRKPFGVPGNLYIIGTMNTADRSVEALDTALRRRFIFREMRPDRDLVEDNQPEGLKVDLAKLMETINTRIERLLDHDHAIGHSFFLKVEDLPSLRRVFKNEILPLLREFFYGNPAKIGMILGGNFVTKVTSRVKFKDGDWGNEDLDEKDVFVFADPETLSEEDFISIYA